MYRNIKRGLIFFILFFFISFYSKFSFAASITLETDRTLKVNKQYHIDVYVDTENQKTIGTDLLIQFNPQNDEYIKTEAGKMYPNYPEAKIYSHTNEIRFSGTSNYQNYITGKHLFAKLTFLKKNNSENTVKLIWIKDKTNETNVVSIDGRDLLDKAPSFTQKEKKQDDSGSNINLDTTSSSSNQTSSTLTTPTQTPQNSIIDTLLGYDKKNESKSDKKIIQTVPPITPSTKDANVLGTAVNNLLGKQTEDYTGLLFYLLLIIALIIAFWFFLLGKNKKTKKESS